MKIRSAVLKSLAYTSMAERMVRKTTDKWQHGISAESRDWQTDGRTGREHKAVYAYAKAQRTPKR
jgi:hypothetical protein